MKVSLKKLFLLGAAFLAIVAFFMMFLAPVGLDAKVVPVEWAEFNDVYFGASTIKGVWTSVVGFALMLVSGVALLVSLFVKTKHTKVIQLATVLALVVAAVLVLLTKTLWLAFNNASDYAEYYVLGAGPIVAAVLSLVAAAGVVLSRFVKE